MSDTLELLMLGCGSPLFPGRSWSSFVAAGRLLFEAPPSLTMDLHRAGVKLLDLDTVFISHFHGDHFAGLPFLLLEYDALTPRACPLNVIAPRGARIKISSLYEAYYPGFSTRPRNYECNYIEVEGGHSFSTGSLTGTAYAMKHMPDRNHSLGFRVQIGAFVLAYTGDTARCEEILHLADGADVLVIECTYKEGREWPTHLSYEDVRELRAQLPSTAPMVLTHLGSEIPPADELNIIVPRDNSKILLTKQ